MRLFFLLLILSFHSLNALEYKKLETNSGINFWFVKDTSIPIISISFSFRGGMLLDDREKKGISNLMTSLLDEGTRNMTGKEFRNAMKLNGMKLSFSSQKDRVDGVFQVISNRKLEGFKLFGEAINHPRFEEDDIQKVKKQIISSIKIDNSDVSTLASLKFNKHFFNNHLFSNNIKGSINSLEKISKEDLVGFHKRSFQRKNLIIGVAGDVEEKEIKGFIDSVFDKLMDSEDIPELEKFLLLSKGQKIFKMKTPQTSVLFGHKGIARSDEEFFSLRIANYILGGGGFQSRLYKSIREQKGLVYSIYSYLLSYENDGVIVGGFQTRNKSVYDTINDVRSEWKKIQKKGVSKEEFENAKAYFNGSFTRNFTSTLSIARLLQIVQYYKLGDNYFQERENIINNLDLKKVNKLIKETFNSEELFFMIVGEPEEK